MLRALATLLVLLALPGPSRATVYAPMDDATLTAASAAIVTGVVTASAARKDGHRIVTDTTVAVDRVYKGAIDGMTVTVTTPGGTVADEQAVIYGAPHFAVGDTVLLYLQQGPHGEVRTTGLALGAFRLETVADGTAVATHAVPVLESRGLADVAATAQALGDPGSALTSGGATATVVDKFTFLGSPPGRWFKADQGLAVRMAVANADADLGPAASRQVIDAAMAAWTNVPTASIVLERSGSAPTAPSVAGGDCDGVSTVQFNDPFGEIAPLSGCFGVLAVGGFCTSGSTGLLNGQRFARISEGDLTVADGLGNCLGVTGFEEVVTHEIGHVIGMGHSSQNENEPDPTLRDATMYFLVHLDGRAASLRADDIAGVSALYPAAVNPDDLDGDGVPNAADACPSTPPGATVDASGCACGEAGHVACDDGLVCTADACDIATGGCVAHPVDCTGGDPCLTGSCDETTGCSTAPLTGNAAVLCVYSRPYPPAACAGERVPIGIWRRLRRASHLADRGLLRSDARLLAAADRQLRRARRIIDRAARRRPQSPACASALATLVDEARSRLTL